MILRLADHSVSWIAQKTDIDQSYRGRVSVSTKPPSTFVTFYYNAFIRPNVHIARLRDIFPKKKSSPCKSWSATNNEISASRARTFCWKKNNIARQSKYAVEYLSKIVFFFFYLNSCTILSIFSYRLWNNKLKLSSLFDLVLVNFKLLLIDVSISKNALYKFPRIDLYVSICADVFRTILMSIKIVNVTVEGCLANKTSWLKFIWLCVYLWHALVEGYGS